MLEIHLVLMRISETLLPVRERRDTSDRTRRWRIKHRQNLWRLAVAANSVGVDCLRPQQLIVVRVFEGPLVVDKEVRVQRAVNVLESARMICVREKRRQR